MTKRIRVKLDPLAPTASFYKTLARLLNMIDAQRKYHLQKGGSLSTLNRMFGKIKCEGLDPDAHIAGIIVSLACGQKISAISPDISEEMTVLGFVAFKEGISINSDYSVREKEIVIFTSDKLFIGELS